MSSSTFPQSKFFAIRDTITSGRGVFATQDISAGTPLYQTPLLPASVILREYKREVCAQCFSYERGRNLKFKILDTGNWFCGKECLRKWKEDLGEVGIKAWEAIEIFIKNKNQRNSSPNNSTYDILPDAGDERPSPMEIEKSWNSISSTADFVRQARAGSKRKPHRRSLQAVLDTQSYPDVLGLLLSATLTRAKAPAFEWESVMELIADSTPYTNTFELQRHVQSYLQLLALLPVELLPHISASACLELVQRDSHNSFGIRSLDDDGEEFFGFGVWPGASYFNHSCAPNVAKRRVGRAWEFWAERDVRQGEELCITYLGGEEKELALMERMRRLEDIWGFECGCKKCVEEGGTDDEDEDSMSGVEGDAM